MLSEPEIKFLLGSQLVEYATADNGSRRSLSPMTDIRELGCPSHVFERVLEDRARRLGSRFAEFRNRQRTEAAAPQGDLESRIEAAKLF